jgi:predicted nucleic acid-binding protein
MVAYADTSFFLSLYTADANHEAAIELVSRVKTPLPLTWLQRHELRNAVRLQVFRKDMTGHEREAVLRNIEEDLHDGFLVEAGLVWSAVFAEAENLSTAHTERLGTRGMDILHVAAARSIGARDFFTFDTRQKDLAVVAGLKVKP